jgi:TRAP transporter TAXI family solute receptor
MDEKPRRKQLFAGLNTAVLLAVVAVVGIGVALRFVVTGPPHHLVIATDERGGFFSRMAELYAKRLADNGVTLEIVHTHGAIENLKLLNAAKNPADIAFINGGLTDGKSSPHVESLGSISYDPLWIAYRSALGPIDTLPKLRGRRISVGREGSGTEVIALKVLSACGIADANSTLVRSHDTAAGVRKALAANEIDAALIMSPPEDPEIRALFDQEGVSILNLTEAEGLSRNLTFLHALSVPKAAVDPAHTKPDADTSIVASTITLVVRSDVHPAIVYLLMSVMDDVHEPPSLLHKENEFPSDKDTDLPLSQVADTYYKSGRPVLQRYLPFSIASVVERLIKVLLPLGLVFLPFARAVPAFYQWRVKRRFAAVYRQLLDVEETVHAGGTKLTREEYDAKIHAIEGRLRAETIPIMYSNELYALREHIDLVRRQIAKAIAGGAPSTVDPPAPPRSAA